MKIHRTLAFLIFLSLALSALALPVQTVKALPPNVIVVRALSFTPPATCGRSWLDPCDLQTAIEKAQAGDEIWVAQGTHKPTRENDRSASFELKNGVTIYGGFSGDGGDIDLSRRDPEQYETILSGEIGEPEKPDDNSYHVVKYVDFTLNAGETPLSLTGLRSKEGMPTAKRALAMSMDGAAESISPAAVRSLPTSPSATIGGFEEAAYTTAAVLN